MRSELIKFCPRCGAPVQMEFHYGQVRPVCPSCGWIHFADPKVAAAVAEGLEGGTLAERKQRAWALLSILSGGVTLARAVADEGVSSGIAEAVRAAAIQAAGAASASAPL